MSIIAIPATTGDCTFKALQRVIIALYLCIARMETIPRVGVMQCMGWAAVLNCPVYKIALTLTMGSLWNMSPTKICMLKPSLK